MVSMIDSQYLGVYLATEEYNEIEQALAGKDFVMFPFRSKDELSRIYMLQFEDEGMRMVVDDTDGKTKLLMKATDTYGSGSHRSISIKGKLLDWFIVEKNQDVDKSLRYVSLIDRYLQAFHNMEMNDFTSIGFLPNDVFILLKADR